MQQAAGTRYRIGSVTKVFTATLIYQLIDAGKLSLTDPLAKFFPDLPKAEKITIANLLGHRSGLANFTENTDFDAWKTEPKSQEELLAMIKNRKPDFDADGMASSNNSNYLLLGYTLERLHKKAYPAILEESILKPFRLKNTYYGSKSGFQEREAVSYKYFNNQWKPEQAVNLANFDGAGAVISTPGDLCSSITQLFQKKIISPKSLETMTQMRDGYGKGLFPYGTGSHPGFGHNGKTEGFASSLQYFPENGLAIACDPKSTNTSLSLCSEAVYSSGESPFPVVEITGFPRPIHLLNPPGISVTSLKSDSRSC